MRKIILISVFIFIGFIVFCQNENEYVDPQNMDITYSREASYAGGTLKLIEDIWALMSYSDEAIEKRLDTELMLSFDVEIDGSISGIVLLGKIGYGVDQDIVDIFKTLKFLPAIAQGKPIKMNVILSIPIRTGPNSKRKAS